ncbi:MAG: DUF4870 domain-containing protein [Deltaproteobacteria bacterium]|nr:DUF4870 domain-containing protein [Deltaproteobacteria bacterium]
MTTPIPGQTTPNQQTPPSDYKTQQGRQWAMFCHLSALSMYLIPFGDILGPLIIWQIKKDEFPELNAHGKEALNFHLSMLIYMIPVTIIGILGTIFCFVGFIILPVIPVLSTVFSIIAGIKANQGEFYQYPLTIRMIK